MMAEVMMVMETTSSVESIVRASLSVAPVCVKCQF